MGLRYRKSVSIGKNTRLNLSKSGIGISSGIKGARMSVGPRGIRQTVGIPGTGIYYTKEHRKKSSQSSAALNPGSNLTTKANGKSHKVSAILIYCLSAFLFLCGIPIMPLGLFLWACAAVFALIGFRLYRGPKKAEEAELITPKFKQVDTKVVGVTFGNRQDNIRKCSSDTDILVVNTPSEEYPHAMSVFTLAEDDDPANFNQPRKTKDMLGYLNDELAKEIYNKEKLILGSQSAIGPFPGYVTEITGGTEEKPTLGCNIRITV